MITKSRVSKSVCHAASDNSGFFAKNKSKSQADRRFRLRDNPLFASANKRGYARKGSGLEGPVAPFRSTFVSLVYELPRVSDNRESDLVVVLGGYTFYTVTRLTFLEVARRAGGLFRRTADEREKHAR